MVARNRILYSAGLRRTFCILFGVSAAMAVTQALAAQVSSEGNVSLTLSGQVNRALLWADDGTESRMLHVDNDNSSTRMNLEGTGRLNRDVDVGAQIEVEIQSNPSSQVDILGVGTGGATTFVDRKLEVYFDHKQYGKLSLGQGSMASDGTSEVDLSGTSVVAYSGVADMAGGIGFVGAGTTIGEAYANLDGLGRDDRIRYDSPPLGNFRVSVSSAGDSKQDLAVRYSGSLKGGLQFVAAGAYATDVNGPDLIDTQISASASIRAGSGFNLTGAMGVRELDGVTVQEPSFWYIKAGYIKGDKAFSVDFAQASDVSGIDDEFTSIGVAAVWNFRSAGTELYAGLRSHSLDDGVSRDDILALMTGARIKF